MTETARKRFSQLKGNDYVEKLNNMLQSVEKFNGGRGLAGVMSHSSSGYGNSNGMASSNNSQPQPPQVTSPPQQSKRKEILVKRESDKKVKLISP